MKRRPACKTCIPPTRRVKTNSHKGRRHRVFPGYRAVQAASQERKYERSRRIEKKRRGKNRGRIRPHKARQAMRGPFVYGLRLEPVTPLSPLFHLMFTRRLPRVACADKNIATKLRGVETRCQPRGAPAAPYSFAALFVSSSLNTLLLPRLSDNARKPVSLRKRISRFLRCSAWRSAEARQ